MLLSLIHHRFSSSLIVNLMVIGVYAVDDDVLMILVTILWMVLLCVTSLS